MDGSTEFRFLDGIERVPRNGSAKGEPPRIDNPDDAEALRSLKREGT
jgi:hypothetical protein